MGLRWTKRCQFLSRISNFNPHTLSALKQTLARTWVTFPSGRSGNLSIASARTKSVSRNSLSRRIHYWMKDRGLHKPPREREHFDRSCDTRATGFGSSVQLHTMDLTLIIENGSLSGRSLCAGRWWLQVRFGVCVWGDLISTLRSF